MFCKTYLKRIFSLLFVVLYSSNAFAEDTPAQVPVGIAIGPNQSIEVSFQNMTNNQGCPFNGAYVIDSSLDTDSKKEMLSALLAAKAANIPVRLRLNQCGGDRPKFYYVFMDVDWI